MPRARTNGIEVEYETFGDPSAAPLLLISGLGSQMIGWDEEFCDLLAGRGFYVIRFDNRDVGLSTWMESGAEYTLDEMAADAVGLLDVLGIHAAHVVGASMGGFIAQLVALDHPARTLSLTSMISGPSGDDAIQASPEVLQALFRPPGPTREERIEQEVSSKRYLLGPLDPFDDAYERARTELALDRAYHPAGLMRQARALSRAPSRIPRLRSLRIPALVIHGDADILVPIENGRRVASAIPGARWLEVPGMGHDVPKRIWRQVADAIVELAAHSTAAC